VGGAINFVSTPIPTERQGEITALYGSDATNQVIARYGSKVNDFAYLMEFTNYGSDGFKSIPNAKKHADDFDVQDYLLKFSYDVASVSGSNNHFGIKLSKTEQDANSSYLGLTESDFSINPFQRYAASQLDNIKTDHDQVQLNYVYTPASKFWQFGVTAYDNNFSRNWYKLQKASSENLGSILSDPVTYLTEYNWLTGALDSPDDALEVRANKRDYYGHGIQVELNSETYVGQTGVVWTLGLRYHQDQEDRFQHQDKYKIENGLMLLTSAAAPGSQTNRVSDATALSGFLDTDIGIGQWTFKPGLRYETIDLTRKDFSTSDPARSTGPTRVRNNTVNVLIPGLGVTYQLNNQWILLAGLHKGFNPPAPGSSSQEEESLNYEAGFRFDGSDTYAEVIGFYNNYNNIVGTVTASTGGNANIGDQFDGGQATVSGLEMNIGRDFIVNSDISLPINFVHTWTNKYEFDNSFNSGFEPWGNVIAGDELPYIPEHQFQASIGLQGMQWSTKLLANYTGERRSEAGQLNSSLLNSHLILDLSADYQINQYLKLFSKIENILDKEYVAAARPYGLRPGKPMAVSLGLNYQF
jgi:Fe(3+) dicitrate transport protein